MTPERQEPYDGRPSRTVLWEPGNHGSRATRLRAGISIKTRYAYIHRQGRQPPRNLCDVPLSGWCRIQGCYTLAQHGMSDIPQSVVEELAIFVTYFFNDSKQTYGYRRVHKALERGWCCNQSREGRCADSMQPGGPGGVSAPPQGPQLPCLLPT